MTLFPHLSGGRGLEVRCHGIGSYVSVDLRDRLRGRHSADYPAGSQLVRPIAADRYTLLEDCQEEVRAAQDGQREHLIATTWVRGWLVESNHQLAADPVRRSRR